MRRKVLKNSYDLSKMLLPDIIVGIAFGKFSSILPLTRIEETEKVIAFNHPKPEYKQHILIVPKKRIRNLSSVSKDTFGYLNDLIFVAKKIIKKQKLEDSNYRLIINGGENQDIKQLHAHLISE